VESLRRRIMDNSQRWGYELVMPPMIEYLESLLTGSGETLDLQTFKIIDQHNGRSLGIRADMTPQVARMDAHALSSEHPSRFFYTGSALRTRTDGAGSSRTPLQFGAELFGHSGHESDVEVIHLMLDNIIVAGIDISTVLLDVGHVGVYSALIESAGLSPVVEKQIYTALVRGSYPEAMSVLRGDLADDRSLSNLCHQIETLMQLSGGFAEVMGSARETLGNSHPEVCSALDNLQAVLTSISALYPQLNIHIDLAELRGYSYHTGMLFTLYDDSGSVLARGGRYDAIGEAFGKARPATGFSGDLIRLSSLCATLSNHPEPEAKGIWAGSEQLSAELAAYIKMLRDRGERVVTSLPGSSLTAQVCRCDRHLVWRDDQWSVEAVS